MIEALGRFGLSFSDLFEPEGIARIDAQFLDALPGELRQRLLDYRASPPKDPLALSHILLELAPHLEAFIARLFGIEEALAASREATCSHNVVMEFKKQFVLRRARRYRGPLDVPFEVLDAWLRERVEGEDEELAYARFAMGLLEDKARQQEAIDKVTKWCALALKTPEGRARVRNWVSFRLPSLVDPARLVPLHPVPGDPLRRQGDPGRFRHRDGFALTDPRMSAREVQGEVHYCIYCHDKDGDFCSKGFPEKKGEPELGFKVNPLGVTLTGCPLGEKISEMHVLKRDGHTIAALAMAMVDNPMVPATGHRICNDCMKACIYQKQDPVNIPQIETRVLTDVLALPYGVEIYDLLTRWNPLRSKQYALKPPNGRKVLIVGMGPAGFTLAHHLTMEGCTVVGIDGLKIEPLPDELLTSPIRDHADLVEPLDRRILYGFGGVAEYGITVRWDKNFLKLIQLTLARRRHFRVFGGVRFGGTLTLEDAWGLGFDHVAIACGSGLPRVLSIPGSLARGMRQASDFLMALQLTGAAKEESLASLQVRLPMLVIGGGLTAIDTATEAQAYYIKQVEKVLDRCERLGEDKVREGLDEEHQGILDEFLAHGRAVRAERERAKGGGGPPNFIPLLRRLGGVTVVYRRGINESPAYIRNHEEVIKALEEGIYYAEGLDPLRVETDAYGHVEAMVFRKRRHHKGRWLDTDEEVRLPARSVFVAAGTVPNTIYEREYPGTFALDGVHFLPHVYHRGLLQPVEAEGHCKVAEFGPFTSYRRGERLVSFLGDTHPLFQGSVVKAMASAYRAYPQVMAALDSLPPLVGDPGAFLDGLQDALSPRVEAMRKVKGVTEIWIRAPMAAERFRPGQFFRLQTYERLSPLEAGTRLHIPLQTVSGAGVEDGMVRLFIHPVPGPSRLAARLAPGQPLVLMGPNGEPFPLERGKTVLAVVGSWGAAVMLALGPALRAAGKRVLLLAAFRDAGEVYHKEALEAGADQVLWLTARSPLIPAARPQDVGMEGEDAVEALLRYGRGEVRPSDPALGIPLEAVDEVVVMGSTGLLRAFQEALRGPLRGLAARAEVLGTVGSPMQCMLKGVCAQCLQWQVDPDTGERTRAVFSCAMQDQPLLWIDIDNLTARQGQNRLLDRITALWLEHLLAKDGETR